MKIIKYDSQFKREKRVLRENEGSNLGFSCSFEEKFIRSWENTGEKANKIFYYRMKINKLKINI